MPRNPLFFAPVCAAESKWPTSSWSAPPSPHTSHFSKSPWCHPCAPPLPQIAGSKESTLFEQAMSEACRQRPIRETHAVHTIDPTDLDSSSYCQAYLKKLSCLDDRRRTHVDVCVVGVTRRPLESPPPSRPVCHQHPAPPSPLHRRGFRIRHRPPFWLPSHRFGSAGERTGSRPAPPSTRSRSTRPSGRRRTSADATRSSLPTGAWRARGRSWRWLMRSVPR